MARTPNYNFERKERERMKAVKKAEKLAAKNARKQDESGDISNEVDATVSEEPQTD